MVALSLAFVSEVSFPGPRAIPVSVGTALLIYAGRTQNIISRMLSIRVAVGIGLISYSVYLWHWPVLAYVKYLLIDVGFVTGGLALTTIIGLSYLSYRFVEQPFRHSEQPFGRIFAGHFVFPTVLIGLLAGFLLATDGYGLYGKESEYAQALERIEGSRERATHDEKVCQSVWLTPSDVSNPDCVINGESEPPVVLWGDSNGGHYVGVFSVLSEVYGFSFRNFAHAACPPVLQEPERFSDERFRESCRSSNEVAGGVVDRYGSIILSASWDVYMHRGKDVFETALASTIQRFSQAGKQVIVVGVIPRIQGFHRECDLRAIKVALLDCDDSPLESSESIDASNAKLRELVERNGATYVDFNEPLCADGWCSSHVDGELLYYNRSHLSVAGSHRLGELVAGTTTGLLIGELLRPPHHTAAN
jgi:hypothetical protein